MRRSARRRALVCNVAILAATLVVVRSPTGHAQGDRAPAAVPVLPSGEMLDRYVAGRLPPLVLDVQTTSSFVAQLRRIAPLWIGASTDPAASRRRLAVAAFALELDAANLDHPMQPGLGNGLVEWACDLVRSGPPVLAERDFYVASIALLERVHTMRVTLVIQGAQAMRDNNDGALRFHVAHAESRFPKDPQWALTRAVAEELVTWPARRDEDKLTVTAGVERRTRERYREAMAIDAVRDEAHLRFGYFELRRGRMDAALAEFDHVSPSAADPMVRYWLHLFRGRALVRMNRTAEAAASFRRAVAEVPGAQAATVALGAALAADRQATDGVDLVSQMLTNTPVRDPWSLYEFPTTRHWTSAIEALRGAMRP